MPFCLDLKMAIEDSEKPILISLLVFFIAEKKKSSKDESDQNGFLMSLQDYAPYLNELVGRKMVVPRWGASLDEDEYKLMDNRTLLHIAVLFGNAWAVEMILLLGAALENTPEKIDTSIKTEEGETALDIAKRKYNELQKEEKKLKGEGFFQMVWNGARLYDISESMQQYESILKSFRIYEQEHKRGYESKRSSSRDETWALEMLGFGPNDNPSEKEIKTAYRKKARKHHPDREGNKKKFQEIGAAMKILLPESNKVIQPPLKL